MNFFNKIRSAATCRKTKNNAQQSEPVQKNKKNIWFFTIGLISIVFICFISSISAAHYSNFYPINGTYQNYNPVRRFLAGQTPCKDFFDYLGLGHLYLGSIATAILGGSYNDSLLAFQFLSSLSLALILFVATASVLSKKHAVVLTNIILVLILIESPIMELISGHPDVQNSINTALNVGNSAVFVRGMILPICMLFGLFVLKLPSYKRLKLNEINPLCRELIIISLVAIMSGIAFTWSNDYGISCWLCLNIMVLAISFCKDRNIIKSFLYFLGSVIVSAITVFIVILILTSGNFTEWARLTFGTGNYQSWYYNSDGVKSYYIYDIDLSFFVVSQAVICLFYLIMLFKNRASVHSIKRYGLLAFANMCSFCCVNEYKLLSGGMRREVAFTVLFATVIAETIAFIYSASKNQSWHNHIKFVSATLAFSMGFIFCVSTAKSELAFSTYQKEGIYFEEVDGYITSLSYDIYEANEFIGEKRCFPPTLPQERF